MAHVMYRPDALRLEHFFAQTIRESRAFTYPENSKNIYAEAYLKLASWRYQ